MPIVINLIPEEAARFRFFMDHYDSINFMLQSGVFEMKHGNATLSFDSEGRLKSIKKEVYISR